MMGGLFETLSGAKGIRAEGKSAQNIANFNAAVQEQQAKAERAKAGFKAKRQAKAGVATKSTLIAKLATGGGLGSPVAGDLVAEQAEETELENILIGFEGEVAAQKALNQAEVDKLSGKLAKQRGKSGARAANVQFGAQLATIAVLSGFGGGGPPGTVAPSTGPGGFSGGRTFA